ncbi:MAG TPA: alpha/beta hydrolase [Bacteroidota bacterium]|nr:alpha/beta hydrolase [Bacteroidota bacterium]
MRISNFLNHTLSVIVCLSLVCIAGSRPALSDTKGSTVIREGEFTADINGLKLWYKVSGSGPVCILPTPGWGPSSDLYFLKMKPLESIFTMIYLDTRGSGRSERPDPHAYTMHDFVADIEGLREHIGAESVWLMGHSDGGRMILNYTAVHGEHVRGLILVDSPVRDTSQGRDRERRMLLRKNEPWFDSAYSAFHRMPTTQKEFDAYIRSMSPFFFSSIGNLEKNRDVFEKVTLSFDAQMGEGQSDQSSVGLASFLPGMKTPALVIVGNDDFICPPPASEYLHREIDRSKLLIIQNAGHFPWLEQPEQFFGGIRDFLPKLGYRAADR